MAAYGPGGFEPSGAPGSPSFLGAALAFAVACRAASATAAAKATAAVTWRYLVVTELVTSYTRPGSTSRDASIRPPTGR